MTPGGRRSPRRLSPDQDVSCANGMTGTDRAVIRAYEPGDRAAVRQICCTTAFRNRGARAVVGNEDAFADYSTQYYTDEEPGLNFVAVRGGRVVGYVLACADSRHYVRAMATRIVPRVLARLLADVATGRHRESALRRYLYWAVRWSWREAVPVPTDQFPAHYHINVADDGQNQQLYSRLSLAFLGALEARGGGNVHGLLTERQTGGPFSRFVQRFVAVYPDARVLARERPTQFGRVVLGIREPMVNRAYGFTAGDFRRLMHWVARRYGG